MFSQQTSGLFAPSVYKSTEESNFCNRRRTIASRAVCFPSAPERFKIFRDDTRERARRIIFIQFVPRNNSPIRRRGASRFLMRFRASEGREEGMWREVFAEITTEFDRSYFINAWKRIAAGSLRFRVDYLVMLRSPVNES